MRNIIIIFFLPFYTGREPTSITVNNGLLMGSTVQMRFAADNISWSCVIVIMISGEKCRADCSPELPESDF